MAILCRVLGTDVHLFGSIHMLPPKNDVLPDSVWQAFGHAVQCVFETDLSVSRAPPFAEFPNEDSLDKHIAPGLFAATAAVWNSLGLTESVKKKKAWMVTLILMTRLCAHLGFALERGADRQVWDQATSKGKRVDWLEDMNALRAFDDAPIEEQETGLSRVVNDPQQAADIFLGMYNAWRAADLGALETIIDKSMRPVPITRRGLFADRHRKWMPSILEHIRRGEPTLIAVGTAHFVGPDSLPALLKNEGYEVSPAARDDFR